MYDIVIVGGGIAGLSAALYAARFDRKVLVIEGVGFGGQILSSNEVENYPGVLKTSGFELINTLHTQVKELNVDFLDESVLKIDNSMPMKVFTDKSEILTKSIILANGMQRRKLNIEKEEKLTSKGVNYCATCDGAFFKNRNVAVIGSGNTAVEDAVFLSNYAAKVYLINRSNVFKSEKIYLDKLEDKNNVEIILNSQISKIVGEDKLESIEIINNQNLETKSLMVDGLFIAVGQIPNTEIYKGLIELDQFGYIKATEDCKTNIDGIFVAGDIRTKDVRQLATAASDGVIAAIKANNYVEFYK